MTKRASGTLKFFNDDKGFGFIAPKGGGKDIFVHISAFRQAELEPEEGMRLFYDVTEDGRNKGKKQAGNLSTQASATNGHEEPQLGNLKFFNEEKGFGFIIPSGGGDDIFLHVSKVPPHALPQLEDGIQMSFLTEAHRGKLRATEVTVIG